MFTEESRDKPFKKNEETPENAYKKARGCSHSVVKICDEVKKRSYNRLKFVSPKEEDMIKEADDISVHVRYRLDAMKLKTGSRDGRLFSKPNKLLKTIRSREWMDEMLGFAFKLKSIAYESGSRYMAQHLFLRGNDVEDANQRLKNFIDQELD